MISRNFALLTNLKKLTTRFTTRLLFIKYYALDEEAKVWSAFGAQNWKLFISELMKITYRCGVEARAASEAVILLNERRSGRNDKGKWQ